MAQSRLPWLPWTVAALLAIWLTSRTAWNVRDVPSATVTRFTHVLPAGQTLNGSRGAHIVAISPDGSLLAYSGAPYGLYLRPVSEVDATIVPGTESYEVAEPAFSPDGRSIAFFSIADQTLKRIAVTGGPAQTLSAARSAFGIEWSARGILFGQGSEGIKRLSAEGGTPENVVQVEDGELAHGPQLLPDGQHVLFILATGTAPSRWDRAQIVVQSMTSGERTRIIDGGSDARYLPTGHIVYAFGGRLYAIGFDPDAMRVSGERVLVVDGVRRAAGNATGAAAYSVSSNGSLLYVPGPAAGEMSAPMDLALMDRSGDVQPMNLAPGPYALPRLSPDGTRVAFEADDGTGSAIYTYELSGKTAMQRVTSGGDNRFPIWAWNDRIVYQSNRNGSPAIWWQALDGAGEMLTTSTPGSMAAPESFFGDTLLYSLTKGTEVTLWTYSMRDRKTARFDAAPSTATMGAVFSPDGRWIAYAATQGNRATLYVQRFPSGVRYPMTARASDTPKQPQWSKDGKEICYDPNLAGFECVSISTAPFAFGTPVPIPKKVALSPPGTRTNYDVTRDGRILGVITAGEKEFVRAANNRIQVVLNWFEEVKSALPAGVNARNQRGRQSSLVADR